MSRLTKEQRNERGRAPFPLMVLFNPTIELLGEGRATFFEGCLSVGGYMALVERDVAVKVTGYNEKAEPVSIESRGWQARILQHEIDHLRGTLYIDRMLSRTFSSNDEMGAKWLDMPVEVVKREFGV